MYSTCVGLKTGTLYADSALAWRSQRSPARCPAGLDLVNDRSHIANSDQQSSSRARSRAQFAHEGKGVCKGGVQGYYSIKRRPKPEKPSRQSRDDPGDVVKYNKTSDPKHSPDKLVLTSVGN